MIISRKCGFEENTENIWQLEIPRINLYAPIEEGTTNNIMDYAIGHFEMTSIWDGNIGLAAHNRGYRVNYFKDLKLLEKGDIIIYYKDNQKRTYMLDTIEIIEDTNWDYLKGTNDNRLTLITCLENQPSKRRCFQAIEIL